MIGLLRSEFWVKSVTRIGGEVCGSMPRSYSALFLVVSCCARMASGQVVITNKPKTITANTYYNFTATISGTNVSSGITWDVNGTVNGSSTLGTFSGFRYTAPAFAPT